MLCWRSNTPPSCWRSPIDDQPRPLAILLYGEGDTPTILRQTIVAAGWDARLVQFERPLLSTSAWSAAALVVLIGTDALTGTALLDMVVRAGYEGALLLMGYGLTREERRRGLAAGARDVIALPAEIQTVDTRVRMVLQALQAGVMPAP